jgi:hypothetical protein
VRELEIITARKRSNFRIFLTVSNPTISTIGKKTGDPIHQIGGLINVIPTTTAASAAGLNTCNRFQTMRYLLMTMMHAAKARPKSDVGSTVGCKRKNRMSAEMMLEVLLAGALKARAKSSFTVNVTPQRTARLIIASMMVKLTSSKNDAITVQNTSISSP